MNTGKKSQNMVEALQAAAFMHGMATAHLEKLAPLAFEATFGQDQVIFREGDLGDVIYIIETGLVALDAYRPGRGPLTIMTIGAGQLLGWSAFFPDKRKTAGARALTPTKAIALGAPQLRDICQQDHDLGYALTWRIANLIADRLKATRLQLLDVFEVT